MKADFKISVNEDAQFVISAEGNGVTISDVVVSREQSMGLALVVLAKRGVKSATLDESDGGYFVNFGSDAAKR